jgi:hypothetical protein
VGEVRRLLLTSVGGIRESIDRRESLDARFRVGVAGGGGGGVASFDDGGGGATIGAGFSFLSAAGPVGIGFGITTGASFAATACSLAACWAACSACRFLTASPIRRNVFSPSLSNSTCNIDPPSFIRTPS